MGSGASLEPKSFGAPEAEPLERQQYIEEHHVMWDAFTNGDMEEVYKHAASQSSAGALAALGPANFQNCLKMSVAGIGKTQPHPKNVEEAVAVLCRGVALAQWPMAKVGMFTTDHPRQWEVLRGCLRAMQSASEELTAEKAAEQLLESLDDGEESRHFAALVLLVARDCVAGDLQDKALELVGKYLKLHKPTDPYQAGDLLALWYALQWRQKKEEPKWVGKMAVMPFKEAHVKIFVDDSKTPMDLGVSSWEADLKEGTLPEILRDWKAWFQKGKHFDFESEHHKLWDAGASKDWEKVLELTDSQLRPMCARKLGKSNYKTVVILAVRALAHTDKPVETIVQTLKKGMKVLGWPSERAKELVSQIPAEKEEPVLKAFAEEKDTEDAPPEPKKPAISIIEDHHEMWDAYQDKDWEEVMDHVATQVSAKALARLGEANFQNCIRLAMGAIAHSNEEPEDVEKAVEVMKEGLSIAQWESEKIGEYNLLSLHPKAEEVLKAL
ncbi:unnamed protein product [Effrenium voratum]|nr:unnamed protein product [Effrenium voratum]